MSSGSAVAAAAAADGVQSLWGGEGTAPPQTTLSPPRHKQLCELTIVLAQHVGHEPWEIALLVELEQVVQAVVCTPCKGERGSGVNVSRVDTWCGCCVANACRRSRVLMHADNHDGCACRHSHVLAHAGTHVSRVDTWCECCVHAGARVAYACRRSRVLMPAGAHVYLCMKALMWAPACRRPRR